LHFLNIFNYLPYASYSVFTCLKDHITAKISSSFNSFFIIPFFDLASSHLSVSATDLKGHLHCVVSLKHIPPAFLLLQFCLASDREHQDFLKLLQPQDLKQEERHHGIIVICQCPSTWFFHKTPMKYLCNINLIYLLRHSS